MPINYQGFVNPGYAVADELQQILARRRQDERVRMVDEVNRRESEARMQEADVRSQAYKAEQEAVAEWRKAQADNLWLNQISPDADLTPDQIERLSQMNRGDLVKWSEVQGSQPSVTDSTQITMPDGSTTGGDGIGPDDADEMQPFAAPQAQQTQAPPTPAQRQAKFAGLPKDLEARRKQELYRSVLQDPTFKDLPPMVQALMYNQITGDNPPAGINTDKGGGAYYFDETDKQLHSLDDPNNPGKPMSLPTPRFFEVNRPPKQDTSGPGGTGRPLGIVSWADEGGTMHFGVMAPNGQLIEARTPATTARPAPAPAPGSPQVATPQQAPAAPPTAPASVSRIGTAPAQNPNQGILDPRALDAYTKSATGNTQAVKMQRAINALRIIDSARVPDYVKEAVREVIKSEADPEVRSPYSRFNSDELAATLTTEDGSPMNETDRQNVANILRVLRGR